jgi:hypothetical protein
MERARYSVISVDNMAKHSYSVKRGGYRYVSNSVRYGGYIAKCVAYTVKATGVSATHRAWCTV